MLRQPPQDELPHNATIHFDTTEIPPVAITFQKGDVDQNGMVSVEDAIAVLTFYAQQSAGLQPVFGTAETHDTIFQCADIDKNNNISVEDAVLILTYYAKQSAGLQPDWNTII